MAKVWNPTEETVRTVMFGNHFEFKPGQMKNMQEHFGRFVEMHRKEDGLVTLPPEFDPFDEERYREGYEKTPEGQKILAEKKKEGIQNLINHHLWIVQNNQVSLRNDLVKKDPHTDPVKLSALAASKGEVESMRLVAKYQKLSKDDNSVRVREVEKLMEEIGPIGK